LTGENRSTQRKTCPSVTLFNTNPTWTDPGLNPGLRGERSATDRLNHGTANIIPQSSTDKRYVPSDLLSAILTLQALGLHCVMLLLQASNPRLQKDCDAACRIVSTCAPLVLFPMRLNFWDTRYMPCALILSLWNAMTSALCNCNVLQLILINIFVRVNRTHVLFRKAR
jgi:hypothetical protein